MEGAPAEAVDRELLDLPAPPRARRLVAATLMALTVVASVALVGTLVPDIRYFFSSGEPIVLGSATSLEAAALSPNRFVRVEGAPRIASAVRLRRLVGPTYEVFPLAGQTTIFVQVPVGHDHARATRLSYAGRLVTFGQLGGRSTRLREYLRDRLGLPVTTETYLLLADESPRSYGWALGLGVLCLMFIGVDLFLAWRWFRPLPIEHRAPVASSASLS